MNRDRILEQVQNKEWEVWVERPFGAFLASTFKGSVMPEVYEKLGMPDFIMRESVYADDVWYKNDEDFFEMKESVGKYVGTGKIFDLSSGLEEHAQKHYREAKALLKADMKPSEKLRVFRDGIYPVVAHIMIAHGLEMVYTEKLRQELPKYITGDIELFIGDASVPIKKNEYVLMEEAIERGDNARDIVEEYGWIKCRNGFSEFFTEDEIDQKKKESGSEKKTAHVRPDIPAELKPLFKEVQETVYYRTLRTDVYHKLFGLYRSIFRQVAEQFDIPFKKFPDHTLESLIEESPQCMSKPFSYVGHKGECYMYQGVIVKTIDQEDVRSFTGAVAYKGVVSGTVKIVKTAMDLEKVQRGDVLVTQMTFPSYIMAMDKAIAFVTDEGGITCHAAVVSREMKKPCITGTKIATKVLKDGDMVEVDADKGVVRIVN